MNLIMLKMENICLLLQLLRFKIYMKRLGIIDTSGQGAGLGHIAEEMLETQERNFGEFRKFPDAGCTKCEPREINHEWK